MTLRATEDPQGNPDLRHDDKVRNQIEMFSKERDELEELMNRDARLITYKNINRLNFLDIKIAILEKENIVTY